MVSPDAKNDVRTSNSHPMTTADADTDARATLQDVAREAGVGLATVDRVLNKRPGVHPRTAQRVQEAVQRLNYRPDPAAAHLARQRAHRVCFVLPAGSNEFVAQLREQVGASRPWLQDRRATSQVLEIDVFSPDSLRRGLLDLRGQCDTLVVMGLDHPLVREAIDEHVAAGVGVITLVSDVPSSRRHHFVGIDNVAAGRTAASLLGRFLGQRRGPVGVVAGSLSLRDHAERLLGFKQVMQAEYPQLQVLPPLEGQDDPARNRVLADALLAQHPDLVGLYSLGAGNPGLSAALRATGRAGELVFVGHELTASARHDLLDGTLAAVINQDAAHEVRSALRLALARVTREPVVADQERIRIDIYLRDNLP
jgi:LacI family transcriptional regulator